MAASDWAHWDEDRGQYGYYIEDGAVWVPLQNNIHHRAEID